MFYCRGYIEMLRGKRDIVACVLGWGCEMWYRVGE